ncbi:MAG: hypothetical protein JWN78_197 [Bacteroidota bacterium]|nr:hypothetical protein [Bacteroidota bacterium]
MELPFTHWRHMMEIFNENWVDLENNKYLIIKLMADRIDIKVFIASSDELEAERKESALILVELNKRLPNLHLEPILFELDTPSGNNPDKKRIQDEINPLLENCDIAVVIFYSQVGKFTKEEFDLAVKCNKKIFLYFKEGFQSDDPDKLKKYLELAELRKVIEAESSIRYQKFDTTKNFNGLLYKDLDKYISGKYTSLKDIEENIISSSKQHIPLAPRPYLAHPYSLPKNFTGRTEEISRLSEWFYFDKEPVFFIEAIGGMGKSALAWKWLQDKILPESRQTEGIIWWSFYDQSFEDFIKHLFQYCIPEGDRKRLGVVDETTATCAALANHRFLIIMDGFERILRGYSQMMSMYIQEEGISKNNMAEIKEKWDNFQRSPVNPKVIRFLKSLCAGQTKALFTSRLFPYTLEGLDGVKHIKLKGLSKTDTIEFFKNENVSGSQEDMIRAGAIYAFHPLMLKLLSTAINRTMTKDIQKAFKSNLINENEPQKILLTSFNLLNDNEKMIATHLSVFRRAFDFDAAKALFPSMPNDELEDIMFELHQLGFIFYQEQEMLFDFHPIIRSFLYDHLRSRENIHELALTYFQALTEKEKIISIEDLHLVIEQYHHLLMAGKSEKAIEIYQSRLYEILFYQLAEHNLCINLLQGLFKNKVDKIPLIVDKNIQSYVLRTLGECYSKIGLIDEAREYLLTATLISYEINNDEGLSTNLRFVGAYVQAEFGKLSASLIHIKKAIKLLGNNNDFLFDLSNCHLFLGNLLGFQGKFAEFLDKVEDNTADYYWVKSLEYDKETRSMTATPITAIQYSWGYINKIRMSNKSEYLTEALNWCVHAMECAEKDRTESYPFLRGFIHIYIQFSSVLQYYIKYNIPFNKVCKIHFYDDNFQNIQETIFLENDKALLISLCERCLAEALLRSRKINLIGIESQILQGLAHIQWLKLKVNNGIVDSFSEVIKLLDEALSLAKTNNCQTDLADIHLFCAEILQELKEKKIYFTEILGYNMHGHLKLVKECSIDKSSLKDIFSPPNPDEFYNDIPEYEMLKRGMSKNERIMNGYYVAWKAADLLEKKL